jgi:hypothetical protein
VKEESLRLLQRASDAFRQKAYDEARTLAAECAATCRTIGEP